MERVLSIFLDGLHYQGKRIYHMPDSREGQLIRDQGWECAACGDPIELGHPVAVVYDGQGIAHLMCVCIGVTTSEGGDSMRETPEPTPEPQPGDGGTEEGNGGTSED